MVNWSKLNWLSKKIRKGFRFYFLFRHMYIFKSFLKVLGVISFRLTVSCLLTSVHIIIKSFFNEKVHMRAACVYPPIIFSCFFFPFLTSLLIIH